MPEIVRFGPSQLLNHSLNIDSVPNTFTSVHQKSTELGEVRKVLDDLGGAFPKRADDEDELQQWRQQTQSLLDAAVQGLSDCSDPPDTPADDNEILPPGITSPQEYTASEFLFIAAQKLARRFCGIGMPILAMPYQLQAIKIWKALQDQQVDLAIDLDNQLLLTEKYVDIVLSCRKFDETAIPDSLEQLKTLEAAILTLLDPGTPEICNALRRIGKMHSLLSESKEAIRLFQGTLDTCIDLHKSSEAGYLTQIGTTYDLIVEECQRSHDFLTLEALRGRISRDMGPEFVEQRKMLASTIKWCEERGFTVKAEGDYTFTHEKTNSKNTPLHEAARDPEMDMGILEEIMKVEVFYDAEDGNLDTPLLVAVSRKNVNVVAELLRRRPYLVHVRDKRKKTPLHRCRDTKTLSLIFDALIATANLDNPAQKQMIGIESQDEVGQTALHSFCEIGDSKLVELLIDRGADVNARGPYGETPLMLALEKCRNGKDLDHIIRKLARAGAALEGRDGLGHDVKRLLKDRRYDKSKLAKLTSRSYDSSRRSSYRASLDSDLAGTLTATRTNATEPGKSRFRYFWR